MSEQELKPWEQTPEDYLKDDNGEFVLKKDGTPRKRAGKKKGSTNKYHYSSEQKAKISSRRRISAEKKEIEKLGQKLANKKRNSKAREQVAKKLDGNSKDPSVVTQADLDLMPDTTKRYLTDHPENLVFKPNSGPQTDFLSADETDVLYGGAAGGGKSYALLADPLRYIHEKDHRAIILRRTLGELTELIDKSRDLYPKAYPGAKYKEAKKLWVFPSGAQIMFGYLEKDSDVYQYQGLAFSWIGFDELTHLPTSFAWDYLRSRLRSTNPNIKCYMRATTNPGGVGHQWVKERYIDASEYNKTFYEESVGMNGRVFKLSRKFIPAKLADNPYLSMTGEYESMLMSLDPIHRARLLEGDWDINEGAAFPEFSKEKHVIQPFNIPLHWERFKGIDYGYRAPSCCLWFAIDPDDGTAIIYRELYERADGNQSWS